MQYQNRINTQYTNCEINLSIEKKKKKIIKKKKKHKMKRLSRSH